MTGPSVGPPASDPAERPADAARPGDGTRPAFLPTEVDPTVFDEGFLRQLERLLLLMRSPVRGGLKGGRRSVKRGQSVEFADYRDYTMGDDLRQLDWNVYARLERLFVKLFVEEEDVTVTLLIDASASMAAGTPGKLPVRQARGGGARLHRARERGPRRRDRVVRSDGEAADRDARLGPGLPAARRPVGHRSRPKARRTSWSRPAMPAPSSTAAGSWSCSPTCSTRTPTRSSASWPRPAPSSSSCTSCRPTSWSPPLEGDLRLIDSETGEGLDVTVDLATVDAYKARLAAWKADLADLAAKRRASYVDLSSDQNLADLMFAELRRRRVLG